MKRERNGGTLTGGTGDVSPQWMTFSATQSAADTTTSVQQAIPVQRLQSAGKAQVMEVLKVVIDTTALPVIGNVAEVLRSISVFVSTTNFGATATTWAEPRVFAASLKNTRGAFTAGGTYGYAFSSMDSQDLTDGAGHGILVATDNIFLQVQSVATGVANVARCKILYRWKNVPMVEYVGIVQSQQ